MSTCIDDDKNDVSCPLFLALIRLIFMSQ